MDGWSSLAGIKYLGITVHAFYRQKLAPLCLALEECEVQNVDNMALIVRTVLERNQFHLDQVEAVVTDGAANMVELCQRLQVKRVGCMAHMLELLLKKVLQVRFRSQLSGCLVPRIDSSNPLLSCAQLPKGQKVTLDVAPDHQDPLSDDENDPDEDDPLAPRNAAHLPDRPLLWSLQPLSNRPLPDQVTTHNCTQLASDFGTVTFSPPASFKYPPSYIWKPVALCRKVMRVIINRRAVKRAVKARMIELNIVQKLSVDCETRWGTVFRLVSSFIVILPAVYAYVRTNDALPGLRESVLVLMESLPVLKAFVLFWKGADNHEVLLQGDRYSTAGSSWPFAIKMTQWRKTQIVPLAAVVNSVTSRTIPRLYPELETVVNSFDNQRMQRLISNIALAASASVYFGAMSEIFFAERLAKDNYFPALLRHATILVPSTKGLSFLDEGERLAHYLALDELARQNGDPAALMGMHLPEPRQPYPDPDSELARYLSVVVPIPTPSPEEFWFSGAGELFPALQNLFVRFNSIPATSAPAERLFSLTGNTVRKLRASLSSQRLANLAMTQRNAPIVAQLGHVDPTTMPLDLPP